MALAHERLGSGPSLVLLHGAGHRRQAWNAVLDLLTPRREVILVDLPGHGESPPLTLAGRDPVRAIAEETFALFDDLGLRRPHVAGNSLGGALALVAGAWGRAATVTALSPAGFWAHSRQIRYVQTLFRVMQGLGEGIAPLAPSLSRSTPGRALMYAAVVSRPSRLSPEQARDDAVAFIAAKAAVNAVLAAPATFAETISPEIPVTIAWGTRDRMLAPNQAGVAQRRLPHARYVPLRGCGHAPMTDDPSLVARVLLEGSVTG